MQKINRLLLFVVCLTVTTASAVYAESAAVIEISRPNVFTTIPKGNPYTVIWQGTAGDAAIGWYTLGVIWQGRLVRTEWYGDKKIFTNTAILQTSNLVAGVYTLRITARGTNNQPLGWTDTKLVIVADQHVTPTITISRGANGLTLDVIGQADRFYNFQVCDDLSNPAWQTVSSEPYLPGWKFEYSQVNSSHRQRFFRAVIAP